MDATISVISTMAQIQPIPGKPHIKEGNRTWGEVTGFIGMAGERLSGNMMLSFSSQAILRIVSNMLSEEFEEVSGDVMDAVGELTNVICGAAKAQLAEIGYIVDMATPVVIRGKDLSLANKAGNIIVVPFDTGSGEFVLEASLREILN